MLEFIIERYNYWIVIILMMAGLYIVFARGNLVKKMIGLNLFQTSVFIFYITIGKVAGGTAPILIGGHGGGHGDEHGAEHGADAGHAVDAAQAADTSHAAVTSPGNDAVRAAEQGAEEVAHHAAEAAHDAADYAHDAAHAVTEAAVEVVYSNPLPHVLILTAIVVGVATTAVGLSLAVRIREAYGTVEEDELDDMDYEAEFGAPDPKREGA